MSLLRSHLLLYFTQKHCSREDERSLCATATKPKRNCVRTGGDYFRVQGGHGKGALAAGGSCLHPESRDYLFLSGAPAFPLQRLLLSCLRLRVPPMGKGKGTLPAIELMNRIKKQKENGKEKEMTRRRRWGSAASYY